VDNITHSLFGHVLGRAFGDRPGERRAYARAAIWTGVLASNAPDLDFVTRWFAHDRKLAYLLQHRGYTHTVLIAAAIGVLIGAGCARAFGVREPLARRRVMLLGVLAGLLHVGFDALNNYGVHPFWPLDNHWYFGDAVFIVEPWLLAVLIPELALCGKSRLGRALGWVLALLLLGLLWTRALVSAAVAAVSTGVLLAAFALQWRLRPRAFPSLWVTAAIVLVFASGALVAKAKLRHALARAVPAETIVQLATTPVPGNPLCWEGISVSHDRGGAYVARSSQLSLAPWLIAPGACRLRMQRSTTAPRVPATLRSVPGIAFGSEFHARVSALQALRSQYCEAAAALHFIRAAYWTRSSPPVLGDLRYDGSKGLDFADFALHPGACRDAVPPWIPPLAALLDVSRSPAQ